MAQTWPFAVAGLLPTGTNDPAARTRSRGATTPTPSPSPGSPSRTSRGLWRVPALRWVLRLSALRGPTVILVSAVLGRVVFPPLEVPVAVMTALLGVPFLVALARRRGRRRHDLARPP